MPDINAYMLIDEIPETKMETAVNEQPTMASIIVSIMIYGI